MTCVLKGTLAVVRRALGKTVKTDAERYFRGFRNHPVLESMVTWTSVVNCRSGEKSLESRNISQVE